MADTEKFQGKYRISSARWANWDYSSNAVYFVTICTADRSCYFGSIKDGVIFHTPLGKSAVDCWYQIPKHFPFVELGEFVVMPNHVHGIIVINKNEDNDAAGETNIVETRIVETQNLASLPRKQRNTKNKFGPQSKNLASIIRG